MGVSLRCPVRRWVRLQAIERMPEQREAGWPVRLKLVRLWLVRLGLVWETLACWVLAWRAIAVR